MWKKATDFSPSHMYNGLSPSSFQTSGMAPLMKKRRSGRNSVLDAEKNTATAVLLPTDNLITKSIFSFPLLITSCGIKLGSYKESTTQLKVLQGWQQAGI